MCTIISKYKQHVLQITLTIKMESCMENKTKKLLLPSPVFQSKKIPSPKINIAKFEDVPQVKENKFSSTIPTKYLEKYKSHIEKYNQKFKEKYNNGIKEDFKSFCEYCDSPFHNQELLNKHKNDFKTCSIDGCSFKSCSKSVAKHIEEVHTTGLYNKIKNLNTPEEIAKWREDRRKRYPTIANVLLRQRAQEERRKRGELLEKNKSRFGSKSDRNKMNSGVRNSLKRENSGNCSQAQHKNKRKRFTSDNCTNKDINNTSKEVNSTSKEVNNTSKEVNNTYNEINNIPKLANIFDDDESIENSLPKFRGTSSIPNYKKVELNKKAEINVLTGLLGMYGDSSDSNEISESEDEFDNKDKYDALNSSNVTKNQMEETVNSETNIKPKISIDSNQTENINGTHFINSCDVNDSNNVESNTDQSIELSSYGKISGNDLHNQPYSQISSNSLKGQPDIDCNTISNCEEESDGVPEEQPILREDPSKSGELPTPTNIEINNFQVTSEKKSIENETKKPKIYSKVRKLGSLLDYSKLHKTSQNTLLEKLLEPHIRHERNVLLQCVKYVVENKFFGIGQTSKELNM